MTWRSTNFTRSSFCSSDGYFIVVTSIDLIQVTNLFMNEAMLTIKLALNL